MYSLKGILPTMQLAALWKNALCLQIDSARFTAPEGLFKPNRWGLDIKALHQLIHEAIQLAPIDSRKTLLRNIYLAGGASLLPGLAERLELEISALVAPTIHTQVHLSPWRYNAAYLGAQIIASSTQFDTTCVTLDNLNEFINQLQCSTF
uniref:Cell division protein FtsA n=1 Tax=Parascaris equorum TaxID=6256 RepID=A0A914R1N1_PAREQ